MLEDKELICQPKLKLGKFSICGHVHIVKKQLNCKFRYNADYRPIVTWAYKCAYNKAVVSGFQSSQLYE